MKSGGSNRSIKEANYKNKENAETYVFLTNKFHRISVLNLLVKIGNLNTGISEYYLFHAKVGKNLIDVLLSLSHSSLIIILVLKIFTHLYIELNLRLCS